MSTISKKDLRTFLNLLNENGTYQLQKKDESLYRKVIEYFTTKSKSKTDLNIQRIDNLKKKGNSYLADCLYGNKIKKMKIELGDKRLLSLLKDYEFKLKGNLKVINEMYSKLKEKGLTEEDYKEIKEKEIKEMYKYIKNEGDDSGVEKGDMVMDNSGVVGVDNVVIDSGAMDSVAIDNVVMDSGIIDHNSVSEVDQNTFDLNEDIFVNKESLNTSQPPTPNKKINFTNLLIYSRFK